MTQKQATNWVWWLLPVLVARALLPVGYMIDATRGNPAIVMCTESGGGYARASKQPDGVGAMHQQTTQHGTQHSVCPFATALASAPPVESTFIHDSLVITATLQSRVAVYIAVPGPSRINLTRGPPTFS